MKKYTWLPVFQAVSKWLKDYEHHQPELIKTLRKLGIDEGLTDINKKDKDTPLKSIDPFTFFCMFMKFGEENRKTMFHELIDITSLNVDPPSDFSGVPNTQPLKVWLFPYLKARKSGSIPTLWKLFRAAEKNKIDSDLFNAALAIKGTGFTKLTQCLFYTYPDKYLPIDAQTKIWLKNKGVAIPRANWEEYKECLKAVKAVTSKPFWEVSHQAWLENQEQSNSVQYTDETDEAEHSIHEASPTSYQIKDKLMYEFPLNQILYGPPGTGKTYATTEMAVKIAEPQWYQDTCAALVSTEQSTLELRHAIKEKYDELVKARRIDFTTFHQSYSYEDFLEGIRADSDDGKLSYSVAEGVFKRLALAASRSTLDQNHLGLKSEPRIWKISIGERNEVQFRQKCIKRSEARIGWNKTGDLAIELDARDENMQQYWESLSGKTQTTLTYFQQGIEVGDVLLCLKDHTSALAIGIVTSEYRYEPNDACAGYNHVRDVNWILSNINLNILPLNNNTTLVAQTVYSLDRMTWIDILAELSQQQITLPSTLSVPYQDSEAPNYVLIIDEINRGNISRIFGELITLLEPDKRKGGSDTRSVILPYSKEPFYVPDNLYVIGTMNTADKSLAQLDLALRRRFSFVEMLPQTDLLKNVEVFGVNLAQMLTKINQRIEVLLDAEHLIGHSYFMPLLSIDDEVELQVELAKLFENKLLPLLQEYFFDDYQRIGWILNVPEPGKHPDEHYFILTDKAQEDSLPKLHELFAPDVAEQLMDRRYRINKKAFNNSEAYKSIVA
ncbi:MAG: AAA family ATPase [Oceanisphaera sp.]|uniref:AAA family ATPase n=1 Tax=Oceanisphaera sp. TaxID=1929979 RepID=UPI003F9960CF